MLPLPRTRKRLAAPRFDFIFGIKTSFSLTPGGSAVAPLSRRGVHLKPRLSLVSAYAAAGLADEAFFGSAFGLAAAGCFSFFSGGPFFLVASTITIWRPSTFGNF